MVRKEDVDFYSRFSRKDLQSLCKKYNLPANRSSLYMAESLVSYFEKNSLNSKVFGIPWNQNSTATTSRAPATRKSDGNRDSYGKELVIARQDCVQGVVGRRPSFILGDNTPYKERNGNDGLIDSVCAHAYTRKLNEKGPRMDSRLENREVDSGDSPSSSSFEFHVSMEEGINLSVDLNFNPSDWINSMKGEVDVYGSKRQRKSPHSVLGTNNARECKKHKSSGQDTDGHVRRESSISPAMKDNTQLPSDDHSNGEQSLASSAIEPYSRIKEGSAIPDSSGPAQVASSCDESCSKSCCVNPVDLDCIIVPGKKLSSNSIMVAADQDNPAGDLLVEIPGDPSTESFQKVESLSTVICPRGAGSELTSSEAEYYQSNPPSSRRKTNKPSTISSPEFIIDRESESLKLQCNVGKNCLPPNTDEQEKSEVLSEQA